MIIIMILTKTKKISIRKLIQCRMIPGKHKDTRKTASIIVHGVKRSGFLVISCFNPKASRCCSFFMFNDNLAGERLPS